VLDNNILHKKPDAVRLSFSQLQLMAFSTAARRLRASTGQELQRRTEKAMKPTSGRPNCLGRASPGSKASEAFTLLKIPGELRCSPVNVPSTP